MTPTNEELSIRQVVDAAPDDVFYAFATAQGWRDWLCDSARFEARAGGCYQLAWTSGWYTAGTVRELVKPEKVVLMWFGKDDPGPTEVKIELKSKGDGTQVELRHSGFGQGEDWEKCLEEARKGWQEGMENLESIFSTGKDLRIVRRPMLGIFLNDFDEKIAKELGVPVDKGVRIDKPVEGMGAERAGLQPNDVIVEFDGKTIRGFADMNTAFQGKKAGEVVQVSVYRGSEKITAEMELSSRPYAEFPLDVKYMAQRFREIDAEVMGELRALLEGVGEDEAEFNPSPEEWSVKEILAHLIVSEHYGQHGVAEYINDAQREFTEEFGNVHSQLKAVLTTTSTIPELLDRLEKNKEEANTLIEHAEELKSRKAVLWRMGFEAFQYPGVHDRVHMDQMRTTIEAARKG
ncbi:MAG: SRPBCC domain-containing protein [Anaerolineaceae bacterium]|nr:MAG: SRPBCC domain-containing protein [Anaerolineaceae bacterium]